MSADGNMAISLPADVRHLRDLINLRNLCTEDEQLFLGFNETVTQRKLAICERLEREIAESTELLKIVHEMC